MEKEKKGIQEIEKTLQEIGHKIEELIQKGADASADVKEEIEKKIAALKENKTTLEEELRKGKALLEKEFKEKREEYEPRIQESKGFLKEGLKQFGMAFKALFSGK
ncbi:hypothetical protein E4S40_07475 [Algoriphagus kandeliae]|uniref:Uncharacterized protein n=1 Tax=Algoriphagus kandeliae TaxID=2562278 RepID=A0A4Y9QU79_9BACT|nr:hypothetical protein [Algoriphagus kandeliae]TFV96059.1 hypothetical protein E4S40_07475 [Algoriphagus kandeliae]